MAPGAWVPCRDTAPLDSALECNRHTLDFERGGRDIKCDVVATHELSRNVRFFEMRASVSVSDAVMAC